MRDYDDYRYSQEARERDLRIIWRCNKCGARREDYPGWNEGGTHHCGGEWMESGSLTTVTNLFSRLTHLWCRLTHPAPMWPHHGHYECPKCQKFYPVPWEVRS